jgi:probable rRNA maturation factor
MITINNRQRKITIDSKKLKSDAQKVLNLLDYADFDLGILLANNATIHKYNATYRGHDKPTDILSFPAHPTLKAGERIVTDNDDDKNLGDLIIAPEYVQAEAQKLKVTLEQRLQRLLVHGICHLLGYDHIEDHDYKIMLQKEMYLLRMLKKQ